MDELDKIIEEIEWLASLEKELASSAFAIDSFEDAEKHDRKRTKYIKVADLLKELKECRASEPFINKPCISEGVCHEDKIKVLDKIRSELIQSIQNGTLKIENGNEELFRIINKYKESEE